MIVSFVAFILKQPKPSLFFCHFNEHFYYIYFHSKNIRNIYYQSFLILVILIRASVEIVSHNFRLDKHLTLRVYKGNQLKTLFFYKNKTNTPAFPIFKPH